MFPQLQRMGLPWFIDEMPGLSEQKEAPFFLEFTLKGRKEKISWFNQLASQFDFTVLLEAGHLWGQALLDNIPQAIGLHAGSFASPTDKVELYLKKQVEEGKQKFIKEFFSNIKRTIYPIAHLGVGFAYPRVVSMIVNEAHMALDEKLAEKQAIDNAMKFALNYPLGPFSWKEKIGALPIVLLLDELREVIGTSRYRVSPSLRREAGI